MMIDIDKYLVNHNKTIRDAFRKMDLNKSKFVVITDTKKNVVGIMTDGDIRREIWRGTSLSTPISKVMKKDYIYVESESDHLKIRESFMSTRINQIPVIHDRRLVKVLFKDKYDEKREEIQQKHIDAPVVIMAGGKGTRLDPFTRILPKALIPVGEKPIIEIIINNFQKYGIDQYYVSVNHKAKMIQGYFQDYHEDIKPVFITEKTPLGTVGSLTCLPQKIDTPIFITNCDILIKHDYSKIMEFHKREEYDITIVASIRHYQIPYGVCELKNGSELIDISEKPEYDFLVNTGMYILEPIVIKYIPKNKYYDMTDLIKAAKKEGKKVGVYPISEKSWLDVGQWEQYHEAVKEL